MKKVTSKEVINFAVSGTSKLVITPEGVLVNDFEAGVISERLGSTVTITDMGPDTLEVPVVVVEQTPAPEPSPLEVLAPETLEEALEGSDTIPEEVEEVVEPVVDAPVEVAPEVAPEAVVEASTTPEVVD